MAILFRIATGARAGEAVSFSVASFVAGRHPDAALRFDAERDLDVSSRHAEFAWKGSAWSLRDLGSTNGTFVNGQRVTGPVQLQPGDAIVFGGAGPRLDVLAVDAPGVAAPDPTRISGRVPPPRAAAGRTEERIAVAVREQTSSLRRTILAVAALSVVGVAVLVGLNQRTNADTRRAIDSLLARNDSLSGALQASLRAAAGRESGLDSALRQLRDERDRLSAQLRAGGDVSQLSAAMAALDRRTTGVLSAANADFRAINAANGPASAIIYVEAADGKVFTGSGFGVTADGIVVTNRHVILGADGRRPQKIGVQFSGLQRPSLAQIVAIDERMDLAVIQIENDGPWPTVKGVTPAARAQPGDPVAIIGFPHGTDTPMERAGANVTARPSLTVGTVSKSLSDVLQMDSYAGEGSSGSPVFDANGFVIGVVYGGAAESGGRLVYAVPSEHLIRLLPASARSAVR